MKLICETRGEENGEDGAAGREAKPTTASRAGFHHARILFWSVLPVFLILEHLGPFTVQESQEDPKNLGSRGGRRLIKAGGVGTLHFLR